MNEFDKRLSIKTIGHEKNRIAFVRDVFDDPYDIISLACSAHYASVNEEYPGLRSPVDERVASLVRPAIQAAVQRLLQVDSLDMKGGVHYSIVTKRPFDNFGMPRKPHFDGSTGALIAAVLYLNNGPHGGTGFFRHKGTGFELITERRRDFYQTILKLEQDRVGSLKDRSFGRDHPSYERIGTARPIFNSMVVYPGNILHSGDIDKIAPIPFDAKTGRLTINAFFTTTLRKDSSPHIAI